MAETLQFHRLPVLWQTGRLRVAVSVEKAGCGNSGDDPRAGAPQNDEAPLLDPLSLIQGRERWASNEHQRRTLPSIRWRARWRIGDTPMLETPQPHRLPVPW